MSAAAQCTAKRRKKKRADEFVERALHRGLKTSARVADAFVVGPAG